MKLSRGIKNQSTFPFSPWDCPCLAVGTIKSCLLRKFLSIETVSGFIHFESTWAACARARVEVAAAVKRASVYSHTSVTPPRTLCRPDVDVSLEWPIFSTSSY